MGRETRESAFDVVADPQRVASYQPRLGECCTAEDFRVDISGMPRSEWNKSCARVFAGSFLEEYEEDSAAWSLDSKTVGECWLTHFKALQKTHKAQCGSQQAKEARLRTKRRAFRKEQVGGADFEV